MAEINITVNGNHDKCPICKGSPKSCPHSFNEMDKRLFDNYIRSVVKKELQRLSDNEVVK